MEEQAEERLTCSLVQLHGSWCHFCVNETWERSRCQGEERVFSLGRGGTLKTLKTCQEITEYTALGCRCVCVIPV